MREERREGREIGGEKGRKERCEEKRGRIEGREREGGEGREGKGGRRDGRVGRREGIRDGVKGKRIRLPPHEAWTYSMSFSCISFTAIFFFVTTSMAA